MTFRDFYVVSVLLFVTQGVYGVKCRRATGGKRGGEKGNHHQPENHTRYPFRRKHQLKGCVHALVGKEPGQPRIENKNRDSIRDEKPDNGPPQSNKRSFRGEQKKYGSATHA